MNTLVALSAAFLFSLVAFTALWWVAFLFDKPERIPLFRAVLVVVLSNIFTKLVGGHFSSFEASTIIFVTYLFGYLIVRDFLPRWRSKTKEKPKRGQKSIRFDGEEFQVVEEKPKR